MTSTNTYSFSPLVEVKSLLLSAFAEFYCYILFLSYTSKSDSSIFTYCCIKSNSRYDLSMSYLVEVNSSWQN